MSAEFEEMMAFAHAIDPVLVELGAQFNKPVQGEASHKIIGWHARKALEQVGWWDGEYVWEMDEVDGSGKAPVYIVREPKQESEPEP